MGPKTRTPAKVEGVGDLLDQAEGAVPAARPKRRSEDLDLDGAWGRS